VAYRFEWHATKAFGNLKKHGVSFDEATTVFGDPLNVLVPDPDHGLGERRYLLLGMFNRQRLLVVAFAERPPRTRLISARRPTRMSGVSMKKKASRTRTRSDRDTMRCDYDFSKGVRGATASRYAKGANVVVIDPSVLDVFPDAASVNETLRALAPVLRTKRRRRSA
jgi:uncharacterized DUF497 family protein